MVVVECDMAPKGQRQQEESKSLVFENGDVVIADKEKLEPGSSKSKLKNRFEIGERLGQGTYGKVQMAINKKNNQKVAIKTIKKTKIETDADLIRIRREIQIMSSVEHPHIIHIHEVFENKDKMVLVMELAGGGELYDYLSERKCLENDEARRIFRQIAKATYYCHVNNICHRDLKLENILLDIDGNVKIADFGLSNVYDGQKLLNTFCGSPLYASPEIVRGLPYKGPEVDCWSMGVLLYTLVYGAMPFDGSNFKRLVRQITSGDYYEPKVPSRASKLIRHILTVDVRLRATIQDICVDKWLNEKHSPFSCLKEAEHLVKSCPVRAGLFQSLSSEPSHTENPTQQQHPSVEITHSDSYSYDDGDDDTVEESTNGLQKPSQLLIQSIEDDSCFASNSSIAKTPTTEAPSSITIKNCEIKEDNENSTQQEGNSSMVVQNHDRVADIQEKGDTSSKFHDDPIVQVESEDEICEDTNRQQLMSDSNYEIDEIGHDSVKIIDDEVIPNIPDPSDDFRLDQHDDDVFPPRDETMNLILPMSGRLETIQSVERIDSVEEDIENSDEEEVIGNPHGLADLNNESNHIRSEPSTLSTIPKVESISDSRELETVQNASFSRVNGKIELTDDMATNNDVELSKNWSNVSIKSSYTLTSSASSVEIKSSSKPNCRTPRIPDPISRLPKPQIVEPPVNIGPVMKRRDSKVIKAASYWNSFIGDFMQKAKPQATVAKSGEKPKKIISAGVGPIGLKELRSNFEGKSSKKSSGAAVRDFNSKSLISNERRLSTAKRDVCTPGLRVTDAKSQFERKSKELTDTKTDKVVRRCSTPSTATKWGKSKSSSQPNNHPEQIDDRTKKYKNVKSDEIVSSTKEKDFLSQTSHDDGISKIDHVNCFVPHTRNKITKQHNIKANIHHVELVPATPVISHNTEDNKTKLITVNSSQDRTVVTEGRVEEIGNKKAFVSAIMKAAENKKQDVTENVKSRKLHIEVIDSKKDVLNLEPTNTSVPSPSKKIPIQIVSRSASISPNFEESIDKFDTYKDTSKSNFSTRIRHNSKFSGSGSQLSDSSVSDDDNCATVLHRTTANISGLKKYTSLGKHRADEVSDQSSPMEKLKSNGQKKLVPIKIRKEDSFSSDDDDDDFFEMTAETLFSSLLSKVKDLTKRINDEHEQFQTSHHMIDDVDAFNDNRENGALFRENFDKQFALPRHPASQFERGWSRRSLKGRTGFSDFPKSKPPLMLNGRRNDDVKYFSQSNQDLSTWDVPSMDSMSKDFQSSLKIPINHGIRVDGNVSVVTTQKLRPGYLPPPQPPVTVSSRVVPDSTTNSSFDTVNTSFTGEDSVSTAATVPPSSTLNFVSDVHVSQNNLKVSSNNPVITDSLSTQLHLTTDTPSTTTVKNVSSDDRGDSSHVGENTETVVGNEESLSRNVNRDERANRTRHLSREQKTLRRLHREFSSELKELEKKLFDRGESLKGDGILRKFRTHSTPQSEECFSSFDDTESVTSDIFGALESLSSANNVDEMKGSHSTTTTDGAADLDLISQYTVIPRRQTMKYRFPSSQNDNGGGDNRHDVGMKSCKKSVQWSDNSLLNEIRNWEPPKSLTTRFSEMGSSGTPPLPSTASKVLTKMTDDVNDLSRVNRTDWRRTSVPEHSTDFKTLPRRWSTKGYHSSINRDMSPTSSDIHSKIEEWRNKRYSAQPEALIHPATSTSSRFSTIRESSSSKPFTSRFLRAGSIEPSSALDMPCSSLNRAGSATNRWSRRSADRDVLMATPSSDEQLSSRWLSNRIRTQPVYDGLLRGVETGRVETGNFRRRLSACFNSPPFDVGSQKSVHTLGVSDTPLSSVPYFENHGRKRRDFKQEIEPK